MTSTLTIRLPALQREALRRAARALKKTESEYIRDLLARDLDDVSFGQRVGGLAGSLDSGNRAGGSKDSFRESIGTRNRRRA